MAAPTLTHKKFYIVKPTEQINYIKNPRFDTPDGVEDWAASGAGVTIAISGDEQRRGAYSMKVNTAAGVASSAYYPNLSVAVGVTYVFSCDVKGVAGQAMRIFISDAVNNIKATTTFTATGYWQRETVSFTATENSNTYYVAVSRDAAASVEPYYVDGAQFEHWVETTFFDGYTPGCRWTGAVGNSPSYRSANTGLGGELVDLEDYCHIVQVTGLGHGDWNQILTKMTSGGDMYQTHIRKSRNFSIVVDFIGDTLGEIEANRAAVIDLLRPDKLSNLPVNEQFGINMPGSYRGHEQRIIRYQGFAANGDEATQPVDIVCVPLSASLVDTPDLPNHQRAVLNFVIPSGLLQGAYQEGAELDLFADFPAEFIVKRDPQGNWCKWTGSAYASLITGLNGNVYCMAEGPDGKIYVGGAFTNAGGDTDADYLARWNPISEAWEAVGNSAFTSDGSGIYVWCMEFDANGDLYVGGNFINAGGVAEADYIVKVATPSAASPTWTALGTGMQDIVFSIAINPNGDVYAGGKFTSAGGVANTSNIAKWNGTAWTPLSTGLNNGVRALAFAPNGELYIGGLFTNAAYPYLCKWNGTAFSVVGTNTDINQAIYSLAFDSSGNLIVGGAFTNAGGNANADYIAKWTGQKWESLGTGTNQAVYSLKVNNGKLYVTGFFTSAGGITFSDKFGIWSNGAWQPLDIDLPGNTITYSVLPASDGSLYIGGSFSTAGETPDVNAECGIISDRVFTIGVTSASANTYPFIGVFGPGTLKSITNYTTGKSVMFDGLTLQAGEWISLSFDPLNLQFRGGWAGRGNLMRYVVAGSDYGDFYLSPGANYLSVFMTDTTAASRATIAWTPLFWGLDGALL